MRRKYKILLLSAAAMFLAALFAVPFLLQLFVVTGISMEPTLHDGQYMVVWPSRHAMRGDVVVFTPPGGGKPEIKRVIGLPGEIVAVNHDGIAVTRQDGTTQQFAQGTMIGGTSYNGDRELAQPLGEDQYFVMGDNRTQSTDSRKFGPVRGSSIIGRVIIVL